MRSILGKYRLELHHGHGRHRGQVVRVDNLQQVLGEVRVAGIDFELHAGGEQPEAFQQAFDIGVCTVKAIQPQAAGYLGELTGELAAHFADVLQFAVIVFEE